MVFDRKVFSLVWVPVWNGRSENWTTYSVGSIKVDFQVFMTLRQILFSKNEIQFLTKTRVEKTFLAIFCMTDELKKNQTGEKKNFFFLALQFLFFSTSVFGGQKKKFFFRLFFFFRLLLLWRMRWKKLFWPSFGSKMKLFFLKKVEEMKLCQFNPSICRPYKVCGSIFRPSISHAEAQKNNEFSMGKHLVWEQKPIKIVKIQKLLFFHKNWTPSSTWPTNDCIKISDLPFHNSTHNRCINFCMGGSISFSRKTHNFHFFHFLSLQNTLESLGLNWIKNS